MPSILETFDPDNEIMVRRTLNEMRHSDEDLFSVAWFEFPYAKMENEICPFCGSTICDSENHRGIWALKRI